MLAILDFFTLEVGRIAAEDVIARLPCSRTTAYRYLRVLTDAGLLARFSGGYVLGARAIEMDYLIRRSDPLLATSQPIMAAISRDYDCDLQLFRMFSDRIVVTSHVRSESGVIVTFGRGRRTPLFRGAGAKVIIAFLPAARQRAIIQSREREAADAGLGADWPMVRASLAAIKLAGFYISLGELDPQSVGVAAPIVHSSLDTPASLTMVMRRQRFALTDQSRVVAIVSDAAARIRLALDREPERTQIAL
jgi:DNA-binding IclR family transcriptional regulator